MAERLAVAVVQGGPVTEADVSRASAASVARALEAAGHAATRLELDARLPEALRTGRFDVVFPAVHGAVGEDGSLQGVLELLGLAYVGSGVLASAVAMNKEIARRLFAAAGLPIARGVAIPRGDAKKAALRARLEVGERIVIKPASHGSAIGVARLDVDATEAEVARAFEAVWAIDETAIVEHFAKGREVTCGVLDVSGEATALPPTEIFSPHDPFYTFEARYAPGRSRHECPARLPAEVLAHVREVAVQAHKALGCRDLSRVDFVVGDAGDERAEADEAAVFLLEVNTLPGFTDTSLYPEAAAVAGTPMPALCDALVRAAHARGPTPRFVPKPMPT